MAEPSFQHPRRPPPKPLLHPKRVRNGVKLGGSDPSRSWASQRLVSVAEANSTPDVAAEGLEYARAGQTRTMSVETGRATALIQGRSERPYETALAWPPIGPEAWEAIVRATAEQAKHAARLLAGDLPPDVEDLFARFGLNLCPARPGDLTASCTCAGAGAGGAWCKHACCLAYLVADRVAKAPFLLFGMQGLPAEDFLERVRYSRTISGAGQGSAPVYTPVVRGASDVPSSPLEECLDGFWRSRPAPEPDLPVQAPPVSHPLLRRLGPSPFKDGAFPLVGLLATCYEVISGAVIKEEEAGGAENGAEES